MKKSNNLKKQLNKDNFQNILTEIISKKNIDVDKNMNIFKKRLRASYMTGNDEFASILVGATDFYEVLSKMELVGRIAEHDKNLINELQEQISELNDLELELKQKSTSVLSKIEETESDEYPICVKSRGDLEDVIVKQIEDKNKNNFDDVDYDEESYNDSFDDNIGEYDEPYDELTDGGIDDDF